MVTAAICVFYTSMLQVGPAGPAHLSSGLLKMTDFSCGLMLLKMEQYPKGSALFINQGGYEAGYIRHLSISNLTGDAPNHTYEHG